jgi:hypothetical protein
MHDESGTAAHDVARNCNIEREESPVTNEFAAIRNCETQF